MGKTYRRKDIQNSGWYYADRRQAPDNVSKDTVADNIFHSDKPKRWSGISSSVKEQQNRIARSDKRKMKTTALLDETEELFDDATYARKANKNWQFS